MPDRPDLSSARREYDSGGLTEAGLAATWRLQFEAWLADAVAAHEIDPHAMVLATADPDGRPSSRTVLCRGVDERGYVFFTNLLSRKGRALAADPRAALTFLWTGLSRQVNVTGRVEQLGRREVAAYARSRPRDSQLGAWASPQSEVVEGRAELEARLAEARARFGDDGPIPVPDFWGGFRVLPLTVEFWAGRTGRLHDRLRFRRADGVTGAADDGRWVVERLAP